MTTYYTQGPWYLFDKQTVDNRHFLEIRHKPTPRQEETIATVHYSTAFSEALGNAELIAAAPDLAEALMAYCRNCTNENCRCEDDGPCITGEALRLAGITMDEWLRKDGQE